MNTSFPVRESHEVELTQPLSSMFCASMYLPFPSLCSQVLTAEPAFFTYTAVQGSRCAVLSSFNVRQIVKRHPHVILNLAMSVVSNLSPQVRSMDFAIEWMLVESGKALYKQDTKADSTYVVLSGMLENVVTKSLHEILKSTCKHVPGRLRSVITRASNKRELVCEYGRGELTGIVETLMNTPRSTTVLAVRDTEVAKLPAGLLDFIKMRFPQVLMRLIKLLGEKLQRSWEKGKKIRITTGLGESSIRSLRDPATSLGESSCNQECKNNSVFLRF